MGSCYSSSIGKKKKRDEKELVGTGDADPSSYLASASAKTATSSPPKRQRHGGSSGRWRKMKSGFGGGGQSLSDEGGEFLQISRRMFLNSASKTACLYTQQGKKGTNQDAMLVWENFSSRSDTIFCGVFDGHGPYGHMVAKKVRDSLPLILCNQWKASSSDDQGSLHKIGSTNSEDTSIDDEWHESLQVEENEKLPEMYLPLKQSILKAFKLMDKDLKLHPTIDCFCSGSTAVTLVKQGQDLVVGNVGDSRAVLATRDKDNSLTAIQLTVDLKPDLPREAARIQQCKGRVFALQDEPEVARVWLPNNDSPGLAMARAFGDFCLKDFGLISVPDVFYHRLTEKDEFIVLATDGVWDVLSNKEAVEVVASAPTHSTAARALVDCAVRAWRLKYPTSKNDDCAVVCLFLEHTPAANGAMEDYNVPNSPQKAVESVAVIDEDKGGSVIHDDSRAAGLQHSGTVQGSDEIVPISESIKGTKSEIQGQSKRSLAECISTAEDEEWSALEGITRANSLLSIPRFLSGDKRALSWRKWL
ncbi:PP2C domain-containing protein [Cephalotus follicularis]|uniref:protein-serine/threonine phosphatase n=1 Tax=Cephalotus follicularis TaxID=3775 RepID=A0A1Q3BND7_CEPFO|nr:PP2C domain-containing protein [Cephalotus follicularis]